LRHQRRFKPNPRASASLLIPDVSLRRRRPATDARRGAADDWELRQAAGFVARAAADAPTPAIGKRRHHWVTRALGGANVLSRSKRRSGPASDIRQIIYLLVRSRRHLHFSILLIHEWSPHGR
jgi:hypothetical protein